MGECHARDVTTIGHDITHVLEDNRIIDNNCNSVNSSNINDNSTVVKKKKCNIIRPAKCDYEKAKEVILENIQLKKKKPTVINLKNTVENYSTNAKENKTGSSSNGELIIKTKLINVNSENLTRMLVIDIENSKEDNEKTKKKIEWLANMIATSRRKFNRMKKKKKKRRPNGFFPPNEEGKYECEKCKKQYSNLSYLYTHQNVHTRRRPYRCKVCRKGFRDSSHLKKHISIHSGARPFQCHQCNSKFRLKDDLKKHLRVHTGERPFSCDICGKKLARKQSWINHIKLHNGDKSFACKKCDKSYVSQSSLKQHIKLCHKR